jgi:PPOX class probable F420-dependent enzyme
MAEAIEGRVRELLEAKNFAHVATIRKSGTPLVVPVWVDTDGTHVLLNSASERAWPANLRREGKVGINVMNLENPYEYVSIDGTLAEDTTEGADEHIDALAKKYMDLDEYPLRRDDETRVILKIEPQRIRHNDPNG